MRTTFCSSAVSIILALAALGVGERSVETVTADTDAEAPPATPATKAVPAPLATTTTTATTTPPPAPLAPVPPSDGRDAPDPFVLDAGDRWVLFSTQVGLVNVPAAVSSDLTTWSAPVDALPVLPSWAEWGRTWAPGALHRPDGFVLWFAARHRALGLQCIGVAYSPEPTGPYRSDAPEPLVCQPEEGGSIDPSPFVDVDGTAYLTWKSDANAVGRPSTLYAQRLRPDGLAFVGERVALLRGGSGWERPLIENPQLVRFGASYVLLYSGGWWESDGYATGYATCAGPLGPCTKVTVDGPVHATHGDQAGPGGASVVAGPAGDQWVTYHAWTAGRVGYGGGGLRSVHFAPITWDGTSLAIG
jgi:hypothetical protein